MRCSLNPKAQAVNKAQRQLRPEQHFPIFFLIAGSVHTESLVEDVLIIIPIIEKLLRRTKMIFNLLNLLFSYSCIKI